MKIIISPAKTQNRNLQLKHEATNHMFHKETLELVQQLKKMNTEQIAKLMKLKQEKALEIYNQYQNFENQTANHAIATYNGLVFKGLELQNYEKDHFDYLQNNVTILSALYGKLRPFDLIKPYRLDMTMKVDGLNLYSFWNIITDNSDESILNLASKEFSKMISKPVVNVVFKVSKNDKLTTGATNSKKMRGIMLNWLILNRINDIESVKQFDADGYIYMDKQSDENNLVFVKKIVENC